MKKKNKNKIIKPFLYSLTFLVIVIYFFFFLTPVKNAQAGSCTAGTNGTWTGTGDTNNWSDSENWANCDIPDTNSEIAVFNSTSTKDVTIDASVAVYSIDIQAGYTGTITQNSGVNITIGYYNGNGSFTQSAGTFNAGDGIINLKGSNFTFNGGTFNPNNGTVELTNYVGNYSGIILNKSLELYNLDFHGDDWAPNFYVTNNGYDLTVTNNLALTAGKFVGDTIIKPENTITIGAGFGYDTTGTIIPVGNVTVTSAEDGSRFPSLTLNPGNTFNAPAGILKFGWGRVLTYNGGTFNHNNGTIEMTSVSSIPSGIVLDASLDLNNLTFNGTDGGQMFYVTNNGYDLKVANNLALTAGKFVGDTIIKPENTITIGAGFGYGTTGTIIPVGNVTVTGAEDGSRFPSLTLNPGNTFNAPAGILKFGWGRVLTYNGGTFNHNNGTIEMTSVSSIPSGIVLDASLDLNNLTFNGTDGGQMFYVTNNGYNLDTNGDLNLTQGRFVGGNIIAKGNVNVGSSFNGGPGQVVINSNNNVTVANGATTPTFIGTECGDVGTNRTFVINGGSSSVYFGSSLNISTLSILGTATLHAVGGSKAITARTYNHPVNPTLDNITINTSGYQCFYCGDGVVDTGETCDDGNSNNYDGCSNTCQLDTNNGNDIIYGGSGDDIINGGYGDDTLYSGSGMDTLNGGLGSADVCNGNSNTTFDSSCESFPVNQPN